MENFKNLLKYWFMVIGWSAVKKAIPISKVWDKVMEIVISLVIAALFVIAYGRIVDTTLPIGVNFATLGFYVAVIFVGRLVVNLVYLPAKLHHDQQERIKELELEIKDFQPSLSKIEVTAFNDSHHTVEKVGIDIHNFAGSDLTEIDIELTKLDMWIVQSNLTDYMRYRVGIDGSNCHFKEWANNSITSVKALDHQVVYLAKIEGENIALLLEKYSQNYTNDQNYVSQPGDDLASTLFFMQFEIRGKLEGRTLSQRFKARIEYLNIKTYSGASKTGTLQVHTSIEIEEVERI